MAKRRWPLEIADTVATEIVGRLEGCCERIEVAGSIRRRKPDVGDVELLCIPRVEASALTNLLGEEISTIDLLDRELQTWLQAGYLDYRLNSAGHRIGYGPFNKFLVHLSSGMSVDVFSTTERNWGMALFIRTGPAKWNVKAMTRFLQLGLAGHAYRGITDTDGRAADCPDEETVFRHLEWQYVPPEQRRG